MASVELRNVSKVYGQNIQAVKNASLKIADGEFLVLIGPSGCGKSTLLRMIAGLEDISAGVIKIGAGVVNRVPSKDRNIAMVFQNYALYPHMTVYQNMAFGLKLRKYASGEIDKRVLWAADILDLKPLLKRKPKHLSGGQRQRVAVGRAIVRKPEVFLFDEPLSNLDAKLRVQMRVEISKLHKKLKTTMIYVTHDQVEAMTMADRIVILNRGEIQQIGAPLDVYNLPRNRFVAGFIGSPTMNFFEGHIVHENGIFFKCDDFRLALKKHVTAPEKTGHGREVTLGVRPEHVSVLNPREESLSDITATVEIMEPMGNELFVHCLFNNCRLTLRCQPEAPVRIGEKIPLSFNRNKLHLFDKADGQRLSAAPEDTDMRQS